MNPEIYEVSEAFLERKTQDAEQNNLGALLSYLKVSLCPEFP